MTPPLPDLPRRSTSTLSRGIHNVADSASRRRFFERVVPLGQLDALLSVAPSFDDHERAAIERLGVPVAVVGGHARGLTRVGIDEADAAFTAVRHLIDLGHRSVGLISFAPDDHIRGDATAQRRHGFMAAMRSHGLPVVADWVVYADNAGIADGMHAAARLLTMPQIPTAIFAMSDELAIGAIHALRQAGTRVPEQVSVVGFDDHEMADAMNLTTILHPVRLQASTATNLLVDRLRGAEGVVQTDLPVQLTFAGRRLPCPERGGAARAHPAWPQRSPRPCPARPGRAAAPATRQS